MGGLYFHVPAAYENVLLLHMDGTNDSTVITDSSSYNHTCTAYGTAKLKTDTKKFGSASGRIFNNGPDRIEVNNSSVFDLTDGAWCIDFWFNNQSAGSPAMAWGRYRSSGGPYDGTYVWFNNSGATNKFQFQSTTAGGSNTNLTNNTSLGAGWYHVALTWDESTLRWFLNGNSDGESSSIVMTNYSTNFSIGGKPGGYGSPCSAYFDEFRIAKGSPIWTSSFTPPTGAY